MWTECTDEGEVLDNGGVSPNVRQWDGIRQRLEQGTATDTRRPECWPDHRYSYHIHGNIILAQLSLSVNTLLVCTSAPDTICCWFRLSILYSYEDNIQIYPSIHQSMVYVCVRAYIRFITTQPLYHTHQRRECSSVYTFVEYAKKLQREVRNVNKYHLRSLDMHYIIGDNFLILLKNILWRNLSSMHPWRNSYYNRLTGTLAKRTRNAHRNTTQHNTTQPMIFSSRSCGTRVLRQRTALQRVIISWGASFSIYPTGGLPTTCPSLANSVGTIQNETPSSYLAHILWLWHGNTCTHT